MLTDKFYRYLAEQFKNESQGRDSFYIAVGEGLPAWDNQVASIDRGVNRLAKELFRKAVPNEEIIFVDSQGEPSTTPTALLQFQITLSIDEATGTLRECGLFGGNASGSAGSGTLLAYFTHLRLEKNANAVLERKLRLNLNPQKAILAGHLSRYLGNAVSEELHDLDNQKGRCQIDELRIDRRAYFETTEQAIAMGYDYCAYCFGKELSTR